MTSTRGAQVRTILVAAGAALAVAAVGGTLTRIGPWYRALAKPPWTPPDAAFGLIWTVVFSLTAIAGVLGWRSAKRVATREWLIGLYALNGFLNVLWSLLFFTLHRPDWALVEVAGLWLSILALMVVSWPLSRLASLLLAPYLAWVSVASLLNFDVTRLNAPFG